MFEWFYNIDISDQIAICAILTSLLASIISVVIASVSYYQNNKLYKESNRPSVVISLDSIAIDGHRSYYFIVKNYGNVSAKITSITCNKDLGSCFKSCPFVAMNNTTLAPNQSLVTCANLDNFNDIIKFDVYYSDFSRKFHDTYEINTLTSKKLVAYDHKFSDYDALTRVVKSSLQENIKSKF